MVRLGYAKRTVRAVLRDPRHGVEDAWEDLCRLRERPAPTVQGISSPQWELQLHEFLGVSWPCEESAGFESVWRDIQATLRQGGLRRGRGAYGGWDDGDSGLARAVWCITVHLRAQQVVETGVRPRDHHPNDSRRPGTQRGG